MSPDKAILEEVIKWDLTGGSPNGEVLHTLIPPGILRGQASLRMCLGEKDLHKDHRFILNSGFLNLAFTYLSLPANPGELISTLQSDLRAAQKNFLGENLPSVELKNFPLVKNAEDLIPINILFKTRIPQHLRSSRHLYTRKGYLGYDKGVRKGDLVRVLQGCRVPVVLRRVGEYYHHIGICSVFGLMDGEAAVLLEKGEVSMQQFNIT